MSNRITVTFSGFELNHVCEGDVCIKCRMAELGYVRSHAGFWWRPDEPGSRQLTDEEAELLARPSLFPLIEIERETVTNGGKPATIGREAEEKSC